MSSTSPLSVSPSSSPSRRRRKRRVKSPVPDRTDTPSRLACSPYLVKLKAPVFVNRTGKSSRSKKKKDDDPIIRIRPLTSLDESLLPHHDNVAFDNMRQTLSVYFRATKHNWYSIKHLQEIYEQNEQKLLKEKKQTKKRDLKNIEHILKIKRDSLLSRLQKEVDKFEAEEERYTNKYLKRNDKRFDESFEKYNKMKNRLQQQQQRYNNNTTNSFASCQDDQLLKNSNGKGELFGKNVNTINMLDFDDKDDYDANNDNHNETNTETDYNKYIHSNLHNNNNNNSNTDDEAEQEVINKHIIPLEADDNYIDRGKIIHAAVHITSPNTMKDNYRPQKNNEQESKLKLKDWNEEENENALTMLILEHTEHLLKLWNMANNNTDHVEGDDYSAVNDSNIPVRVQFLAHAAARKRIVRAVRNISTWWYKMKKLDL